MPHGPFSTVGARAIVRSKHVTELQNALLNAPTYDDLGSPFTVIGVGALGDRPASASLGDGYIAVDGDVSTVYMWDGDSWVDGGTLQGEQGEQGEGGPPGIRGPAGEPSTLTPKGTVALEADLPDDADVGDVWIVDADGDGYGWDGDSWNNLGPFQGPEGPGGVDTVLRSRVDPGTVGDVRTALSWNEDDAPDKTAIFITPLLFGAVGDGSPHALSTRYATLAEAQAVYPDATALAEQIDRHAIQKMLDAFPVPTGPVTYSLKGYSFSGGGRDYFLDAPIGTLNTHFITFQDFEFNVIGDDSFDDILVWEGACYGKFRNVNVKAWGGYHASIGTETTGVYSGTVVTENVWRFDTTLPSGSYSTQNALYDCMVYDITYVNAFNFGPNSGAYQCDQYKLFNCFVLGLYHPDTNPEATYFQYGYRVGSGTPANMLMYNFYGCGAMGQRYNLWANAVDCYWIGGIMQTAESNVKHTGGYPLHVTDLRSELSNRLYLGSNAGADFTPNVTLEHVIFSCDSLHADGDWIKWVTGGALNLRDIQLDAVTTPTPQINMGLYNKSLMVNGMRSPQTIETCYETSGTLRGFIQGYTETDSGGIVVRTHGLVLIGETPIEALVGTNPPDSVLYRKTSNGGWTFADNAFFEDQIFLRSGGLGYRAMTSYTNRANAQWAMSSEGDLEWGGGFSGLDTILKRVEVGVLALGDDDVIRTGRNVTASRPNAVTVGAGAVFYDTTLSKPIWSNGTVWKDAAGTTV